jgi:hypothetical protein
MTSATSTATASFASRRSLKRKVFSSTTKTTRWSRPLSRWASRPCDTSNEAHSPVLLLACSTERVRAFTSRSATYSKRGDIGFGATPPEQIAPEGRHNRLARSMKVQNRRKRPSQFPSTFPNLLIVPEEMVPRGEIEPPTLRFSGGRAGPPRWSESSAARRFRNPLPLCPDSDQILRRSEMTRWAISGQMHHRCGGYFNRSSSTARPRAAEHFRD